MDINDQMLIGSVDKNKVPKVKDNTVLNQEDFLKILAATVSNPPIPGSGDGGGAGGEMDFMSQMIQMNMLDQMSALTDTIQSTMVMTHQQQALSLVGKHVIIAGPDSEKVTGLVEKVKFTPDGTATIQVNGKAYNLQSVLEVAENELAIEIPMVEIKPIKPGDSDGE